MKRYFIILFVLFFNPTAWSKPLSTPIEDAEIKQLLLAVSGIAGQKADVKYSFLEREFVSCMNTAASSDEILSLVLANARQVATTDEVEYFADLSRYLKTQQGVAYLKLQKKILAASASGHSDDYNSLSNQRANLFPEREYTNDLNRLFDFLPKVINDGLEDEIVKEMLKNPHCAMISLQFSAMHR